MYVSYKSIAILTIFRLFSPGIFAVLLLVISREKLGRNTKVSLFARLFRKYLRKCQVAITRIILHKKRSNGHIKSSNHHTQKVELSPNHSNHIIMPSTTSQRMHQQQQQRSDNPSISTSPTLNLISVAQRDAILQTQSLKIQQKTRKDYGRNVQLFIAWIQKNYPSQVSSLLIPI